MNLIPSDVAVSDLMISKGCLEALINLASNTNDIDTLYVAWGIANIACEDGIDSTLKYESNSFQVLQD